MTRINRATIARTCKEDRRKTWIKDIRLMKGNL